MPGGTGFPSVIKILAKCMGRPPIAEVISRSGEANKLMRIHLSVQDCKGISYTF